MRRSCFTVATLYLIVAGVNHGYRVSAAGEFTPCDRSSKSSVIYDGPADGFLKLPANQGATELPALPGNW